MESLIYKICPLELWQEAESTRTFTGAPVDVADGYIHFSTARQLAETAAKHFADQHDLLLVTVAAEALGDKLKWEPSRGDDLFPHLYGNLDLADVMRVDPFPIDDTGVHAVPDHARSGELEQE